MFTFDIAADPHRDWLHERNRLMATANDDAQRSDEELTVLSEGMVVIERRIVNAPARTPDGVAAKMLMLLQLTAEGNEIGEELAARAVHEAQSVLDMGSLAAVSKDLVAVVGKAA